MLSLLGALVLPAVADARVVEVGFTSPRPAASCPQNPCQAVGRVSGYQVSQGSRRDPYRVMERGKIVAFTLTLGRPTAAQARFFSRLFAGRPLARISVVREERGGNHRLEDQSEVFELSPYFGSSPTFALNRPLRVGRGAIIALTIPTWAPAFAIRLGRDEAWRSSRRRDRCDDVRQSVALQVRGRRRVFGCVYRTARLLYTATFVPEPQRTSR